MMIIIIIIIIISIVFNDRPLNHWILRFVFVPYHLLIGEILIIRRSKTIFVALWNKKFKTLPNGSVPDKSG
jgi:hypothetical protein